MAIPAEQQAHRDAFGKALTVWMKRHGLSQQIPHDWAKAAESQGPWNSQVSTAQRGLLDPKPTFFVALGQFNGAIAAKDMPVSLSRRAKDLLLDTEPYLNADGKPATALDFFAQFIGMQELHSSYALASRTWTEEDAKGVSEMCRTAFRKIAMSKMLPPGEAWEALKPHCSNMSRAQVERFREVLAGWSDWSVEEIEQLSPEGELGIPAQALNALGGGLTIPAL